MMNRTFFTRCCLAIGLMFALCSLEFGCTEAKKIKPDPFFEKWRTMADSSKGHSPKPRERKLDSVSGETPGFGPAKEVTLGKEDEPSQPELPGDPVSLKMRDAQVAVVLRALAKGVGQNIVVHSGISGKISVNVNNVPWDEAFLGILSSHGLTYEWEGSIIRVMNSTDMKKDQEMESIRQENALRALRAKAAARLLTTVVQVDFADPVKLKENVEPFLSKDVDGNVRGIVSVDDHNNALIILAVQDDLEKIIALVNELDRPTPQIRIEASIVETTRDQARELGIQWGGSYARYDVTDDGDLYIMPGGTNGSIYDSTDATRNARTAPLDGSYNPTLGGDGTGSGTPGLSGQGMGINFPADLSQSSLTGAGASLGLMFGTIGGNILEMQLSALAEEGLLNILSSPSITTLDNQTAYTENGEKVPYVSISEGETEVKFEDAVLRLEITPHVIDENHLKMKVLVKKDEVDSSRSVQGNPYIIKKQTETTLIVQDSETIVISGLTKTRASETDRGVPWLKDIPGLGWFFKSEGNNEQMEEVLIFLTPHVLPPYQTVVASQEDAPTQLPE